VFYTLFWGMTCILHSLVVSFGGVDLELQRTTQPLAYRASRLKNIRVTRNWSYPYGLKVEAIDSRLEGERCHNNFLSKSPLVKIGFSARVGCVNS
jgi:hypothetical protein